MSIETSCLSRRITIGERTVRLRPPTIRQAVEIMYVLKHQEDEHDVRLLFELLRDLQWYGGIDILIHLRNQANNKPSQFYTLITGILMQGYDPVEETKNAIDRDKEKKEEPEEPDWKRLISDYCEPYQTDPYCVWNNMPFPFFMEFLPEARRQEARNHIYASIEASFAMGGSDTVMEGWRKQAGWKDDEKSGPKKERKTKELTEEQLQRNREKIKNLFNRS